MSQYYDIRWKLKTMFVETIRQHYVGSEAGVFWCQQPWTCPRISSTYPWSLQHHPSRMRRQETRDVRNVVSYTSASLILYSVWLKFKNLAVFSPDVVKWMLIFYISRPNITTIEYHEQLGIFMVRLCVVSLD